MDINNFHTESVDTLGKEKRDQHIKGDTFVSNTLTLNTPDNIRAQNKSFNSGAPKESFYSGMALSKSAFDTGFRERIRNNLSQQH